MTSWFSERQEKNLMMIADKKKFLFDRSFDDEEPVVEVQPEEPTETEEEDELEEVAPTFSEEDLEAAREESFDLGRESGTREALEGIETRIAEQLGAIEGKLSELFQIQNEANERTERDSVTLAKELVLKLFPLLNQSAGFDHISQMAEEMLGNLINEARVIVRVNDELNARIEERLESFLLDRGFEGILTVLGDPQIAHGDCRIEWSNGSTDRNMTDLLASIDQIIERNEDFFENTTGKSVPADTPAEAEDRLERPTEEEIQAPSNDAEPMENIENGPVRELSGSSNAESAIEDSEPAENVGSDGQTVTPLDEETSSGAAAEPHEEELDNVIANSETDLENLVSADLPDVEEQS